jgi:hypothetical protein
MNNYQLPSFVDYPEFFNVREYSSLFNNLFSYIISPYPIDNGYSIYIGSRNDYVFVRLSDFKSSELDITDHKYKSILKHVDKLLNIMKVAKIRESCYYFSNQNDPILVDVMLSANKFMGPGMIRDVFSKTVPTQEIMSVENLMIDNYDNFSGKYIKPSRFKYVIEKEYFRPLYGMIK